MKLYQVAVTRTWFETEDCFRRSRMRTRTNEFGIRRRTRLELPEQAGELLRVDFREWADALRTAFASHDVVKPTPMLLLSSTGLRDVRWTSFRSGRLERRRQRRFEVDVQPGNDSIEVFYLDKDIKLCFGTNNLTLI